MDKFFNWDIENTDIETAINEALVEAFESGPTAFEQIGAELESFIVTKIGLTASEVPMHKGEASGVLQHRT